MQAPCTKYFQVIAGTRKKFKNLSERHQHHLFIVAADCIIVQMQGNYYSLWGRNHVWGEVYTHGKR